MFRRWMRARQLAKHEQRNPGSWPLGEVMAEDRFETLRGEARDWSLSKVEDYAREVGADAARLMGGLLASKGTDGRGPSRDNRHLMRCRD